MWMSTSFIAVCLLLMLFRPGATGSTTDATSLATGHATTSTPDPLIATATTHPGQPTTHHGQPTSSTAAVNSAAGDLGEACKHGPPDTCTGANLVCDLNDPTGHICKLKHGQPCSGGNSENCTNGASCTGDTCTCTHDRPVTTSGLCSVAVGHRCAENLQCGDPNLMICEQRVCKIPVTQSCKQDDHCVAGANCTGQRCACDHGWKTNDQNNTCVPILPAGHICTTDGGKETNPNHGDWCTVGSTCANSACNCNPGFYDSQQGECLPRIGPGKVCSFVHPNDPCVDGAWCTGHICECNTEDYFVNVQGTDTCKKRHNVSESCSDNVPCVPNATCQPGNHICQCEHDFFHQESTVAHLILCEHRKPGDGKSECFHKSECVDNADCVGPEQGTTPSHCHCNNNYYLTAQGRCEKRLPWDSGCQHSINDECLEHGFCDAFEHCKCRDYAYRMLDNTCAPTLNNKSPCQLMNRDSKQCGNGTRCVFRSNDPYPVCGCDIDHFFHDNECVPRILVGNPCAYIDSTFQRQNENQCVDNAHCDFDSFHICVCDSGHYSRQGYCPAQVAAGDTCDPWDHNENQCADYNTCVHGRCQ